MSLFDSAENIEIGRGFVDRDERPVTMCDGLRVGAYLRQQRETARRRGCCGNGRRWTSPMGMVCCRDTREPCPRENLAAIVEAWAMVNDGSGVLSVT